MEANGRKEGGVAQHGGITDLHHVFLYQHLQGFQPVAKPAQEVREVTPPGVPQSPCSSGQRSSPHPDPHRTPPTSGPIPLPNDPQDISARSSPRSGSPTPSLASSLSTNAPYNRGAQLLRTRALPGAGGRKNAEPLQPYQPPHPLLPAEDLKSQFKERLRSQRQTTYSPADLDSIDLPAILKEIDSHVVTFINTQTGSGKSTLVPKALLEASPENRIVTTQPRRTATIRLAMTVAGMRNEVVGEEVGYWIRGDRRGGKETRLWYMTSYTLLLYLLNNRMAPPFSHIIIDEFHERQPEIEVLVALLRLLLKKPRGKNREFRLILMSATLNTEAWEQYFSGLSWGIYSNDKQQYPVFEYHLEEASLMTGAALRRPATFSQAVVNPEMYDNGIFVAKGLIQFLCESTQPQHSILVFLPGRAAVSKFARWVETNLSHRLWAIPWHGSVELRWIQEQISSTIPGKQKVYLATDVAEVSVTLPDVVFVIDTCLVKRPHIDYNESSSVLFPQLVQQWASRGSVTQRQGRVGRTQQGFYFSLLPVEYADQLADYLVPPICHSRLDDLTLHLLHICSNPRALYALCKRTPHEEAIKVAISSLKELGAIVTTAKPDGTISWAADIVEEARERGVQLPEEHFQATFLGRILQRLPINVQTGLLVFLGFVLGLETLTIVCAAIIQTAIPFVTITPPSTEDRDAFEASYEATALSKERTHRALEFFCRSAESDMIACMVVYLEWKRRSNAGDDTVRWAEEMCVSLERLVAIDELVVHIHNEVRSYFPCQTFCDPGKGIVDSTSLIKQLKVHQDIVLWLISVTFAGNAVQVRQVRNESRKHQRESGYPFFLKRVDTYPDTHIPSVVSPWRLGSVVVPVAVSVGEGRNHVSVQQTLPLNQFLLLLLMMRPVVEYGGVHEDAQGAYRPFAVTINSVTRRLRCSVPASDLILQFRSALCMCVSALQHRRQHNLMDDVTFINYLQENTRDAYGSGFNLHQARVDLMTQLWNAMRNPHLTPREMMINVPTPEKSVIKPGPLFEDPHEGQCLEPYKLDDFLQEWEQMQSVRTAADWMAAAAAPGGPTTPWDFGQYTDPLAMAATFAGNPFYLQQMAALANGMHPLPFQPQQPVPDTRKASPSRKGRSRVSPRRDDLGDLADNPGAKHVHPFVDNYSSDSDG
eukprot:Sspe_Gene.631::Locus_214_Transcript_1_2_Confidence_0.500_Length_3911::g.631::m.631/K18408/TDRD9; ATP-dependent RNA helicase TDRD9